MFLSPSNLTRLQFQHQSIGELISRYDIPSLCSRVDPSKWSAFENFVHLVAYQPVFADRVQMMLQNDHAVFSRYVADNDPLFVEYLSKPLESLLAILADDRTKLLAVFESLQEDSLARRGVHPKFGEMTLSEWLSFFLLHESHHMWVMTQLLSAFHQVPQV